MSNYRSGNGGHSLGHVRSKFLDAIDAYREWETGQPEPTVDFEVHHDEVRPVTISQACGIVWNCTDTLPNDAVQSLDDCGLELNLRAYAAAARLLSAAIKNQLAA